MSEDFRINGGVLLNFFNNFSDHWIAKKQIAKIQYLFKTLYIFVYHVSSRLNTKQKKMNEINRL